MQQNWAFDSFDYLKSTALLYGSVVMSNIIYSLSTMDTVFDSPQPH